MKRTTICIAAALAAALAAGALAGCSSQPASSASAPAASSASASASASASSAAAQSQDELVAELKAAIAGAPTFKSVTVAVEEESIFEAAAADSSASAASSSASAASSSASAEPEKLATMSVYKFDASGDKLKTSVSTDIEDVTLQYFTDGDDAVFVTDGPVYSGKVDQFDLSHAKGFEAFLTSTVGDLSKLADCAASVEKMEQDGLKFYMVTLDPQKYTASDEALTVLAKYGNTVKEALLTVGFNENGNIISVDLGVTYEQGDSKLDHLVFSDYDSTVIDPMPAADRTYEDMEADMQLKLDALAKQLEDEEGSSEPAKAE